MAFGAHAPENAGGRIDLPSGRALWSARGALPRLYGDVLDVWRPWAADVTGRGLDTSHFLVEDRPDEVAHALTTFLEAHAPPRDQPRLTQPGGPAMSTDAKPTPQPRDDLATS
jgi:hypothetical protein